MKTLSHPTFTAMCILCTLELTAQPLNLNSHPSATATIFLDTDGHTVSGTDWNNNGPFYCGASGLTPAQVIEVFNRVAEDYRPFEINVTTDSTRFIAAPLQKRMRVILTVNHQWFGNTGGVAFMNSFSWGTDTPAFVFTAAQGFNVRNISEASSHEAGHTLGLSHQSLYDSNCVKISEYNLGQGSGEIGWAPIMGAGYFQNFTLWNNGPNSTSCTSFQNELELIISLNGLAYRIDDHSATFPGATNAPFTNNQFTVNGIIEQNTDRDMFKMTMTMSGQFRLDAVPYNVGVNNAGSDLDLQVTLYRSNQSQLNIYNPGPLLNSVIDTFLNAGDYYLRVEGKGNIYAPNYASLGTYSLVGRIIQPALPLRRLELRGSLNGENHQFNWIIDADEAIVQQVLEYSTDGIRFSSMTEPVPANRTYMYRPVVSTVIQYRLHVFFDNGKDFYSNTVTLRNVNDLVKPKLIGNSVTNSFVVSSPGKYEYVISNMSGAMIMTGKIERGTHTITLPFMASGMYLIRFSKEGEIYSEKIIKN